MTALARHIREIVAAEGPITVERYMALALGHPTLGYYTTRDPLGAAGDFTTAPEISQMFGELLGLWAAETWTLMGRPSPVRLVELGPGRGTLMADALRAASVLPPFRAALDIHLVETSPPLEAAQRRTLCAMPASWHRSIDTLPGGPAIVVANEFLDALPIRQVVRGPDGWHERLIGVDATGALAFGLASEPDPAIPPAGRIGDVLEIGREACGLVADLGRRLATEGGAALLVDYGHTATAPGETLQALRRHARTDPLAEPGEADITAHVDFAALARSARAAGAAVHGPSTQGGFLGTLGIAARAERLTRSASSIAAAAIDSALRRLTAPGDGMGELFKVMAVADPALPALPGLPLTPPATPPPPPRSTAPR